ncbi:hypothetical protein [Mongoliitalea lutea]|uniref:Uncharacterized protein n=1 Tax=Mongoliitalea lutea TaxID=849756 RepID=A0A8J3G5W0_9BACT|nr:hypothetical protein [Mongoliitalea lutea]GHB39006.1 hypothetical protein GCM10008106_20270 [Mongoliitalea lutea]
MKVIFVPKKAGNQFDDKYFISKLVKILFYKEAAFHFIFSFPGNKNQCPKLRA